MREDSTSSVYPNQLKDKRRTCERRREFEDRLGAAARQETTGEHLAEVAEILAAGLMRVLVRKSSQFSADTGESSLDILATESSHPTPTSRRTSDG